VTRARNRAGGRAGDDKLHSTRALPEKISNYNPYRIAESFEFPEEGVNLTAHLDQLEKTYVLEALRRKVGNQTNAAELLGLSVRSLRHLLDKHGIRGLTAQMRDERRNSDSTPRRRSSDPAPRRREDDESEFCRQRRRTLNFAYPFLACLPLMPQTSSGY